MRHHIDGVDRLLAAGLRVALDRGDALHHLLGDELGALRPGVDHLVVLLAAGDQTVVVLLLVLAHEVRGLLHDGVLGLRDHHVVLAERDAGAAGIDEPKSHDPVAEDDRLLLTAVAIHHVDHVGDVLLGQQPVHELERNQGATRQQLAEQHAAGRRVVDLRHGLALGIDRDEAAFDLGVQGDDLGLERVMDLGHVAEQHPLARLLVHGDRQIIKTEHDILRRHDDRRAVGRVQDVVGRHHQDARLELRLQRQRHVHGHLVAVEIGVEGRADERMQLDRLALDQHRLERLDAEAVQGRRAVEQHRMLADHLIEDVPNLRLLLLDQLLRLLHRGGMALGVEPRIDERLEQLERHLLRQAALMQLELGADHDHRAAGIVDALAEQVLPEPALLALQHVGERLQRTLVGAGDDAAAPSVVEQRIDRLLQHALLVADDDVRRAQLHQPLQTIVAVDDAAIEIVQIGGGEAAAVERHQRTQLRRNHRNHGQDHPLRLVAGLDEGLDHFQPLGQLLGLELGGRLGDLDAEIGGDLLQIEAFEQFADGFGADRGGEGILAEILLRLQIILFREELERLERGQPRLEHDVVLEIENALEVLQRHVEQEADARRQRLQEPDMRDRRGELDMAHALAPDLGERHLDAALLADDALVLHALVLAAQALVILHRAEDARAEQPVALRLEGAIVDRLGLLDLPIRPGQNLLRTRNADADLVEVLLLDLRTEEVDDVLVHSFLSQRTRLAPFGWSQSLVKLARSGLDHSAAGRGSLARVGCSSGFGCTSSTLRPNARISLTRTLNDSGMPASNVSSPRTIAS